MTLDPKKEKNMNVRAPRFFMSIALASAMLMSVPAVSFAEDAPANSGFLSNYERLSKQGMPRSRFLNYSDPELAKLKIKTVFLMPVESFPAQAAFEGISKEVVPELLTYTNQRLREQLASRVTLATTPEAADVTVQVALTAVTAQPEGKTIVDLVPFRLVTGQVKNAAMGKMMEAGARMELRVSDPKSSKPLREMLHEIAGKEVGREAEPKSRVTAESLKEAVDTWVTAAVDQIAPKR
jgi:hypothetical protein